MHARSGTVTPLSGAVLDVTRLDGFADHPFLIRGTNQVIRPIVLSTGGWEPELMAHVGSLLPDRPWIAIGGGHVGLSAFQLWQASPRAREIVVFEPDSVNAALLAMNIRSWGESPVRSLPVALGAKTELAELASNPFNSADNRLWETIPAGLAAGGGDPDRWRRQVTLSVTLDDVWGDAPLDLLFLDTQGWEPEVLRGGQQLIGRARPLVVFEWWPSALVARGDDPGEFLAWVERELAMTLSVVPVAPTPVVTAAGGDVRRLTGLLLDDPDPAAYAELLATPHERA
jgi:FkbM family methyltransferase